MQTSTIDMTAPGAADHGPIPSALIDAPANGELSNGDGRVMAEKVIAAWNSHEPDRILAIYAPGYRGVDVAQARPIEGARGMAQMMLRYTRAFPDLTYTLVDSVGQDDRLVLHWIARGTHRGTIMNIPPTGRTIEVRGVSIMKIEGERVREGHIVWDLAGLLRSMGLLPEL